MTTETRDFATFVEERFGGKLTHGSHSPDGAACFHEALNVYRGREWSDDTTGTLNLIALNDAPWSSDDARTTAMLPLGVIVLAWPKWSATRRQKWAQAVALGVVNRILPLTLRNVAALIPSHAVALTDAAALCEAAIDVSAAGSAAGSAWSAAESARSAAWSAAESAAGSAWSAAWSAESAAWSARSAAESAARSAESAAESARSAWSAESAAESAAWSAESAADVPLQVLCQIMVTAAS